MANNTQPQMSWAERRERIQQAKIRIIENNPNAIVFAPESLVTTRLVQSIMTFDTIDSLVRARAGLQFSFDEFAEHIKAFQELADKMNETNEKLIDLVAGNSRIDLRAIRNRVTREVVEKRRKEREKTEKAAKAANEKVSTETDKETAAKQAVKA